MSAKCLMDLGAKKVTLAPENSLSNLKTLAANLEQKAEVIVYQDTPLFISESCPKAAVSGKCSGKPNCNFGQIHGTRTIKIESEKLGKFIIVSSNCRTTVISEEPFNIIKKIPELKKSGAVNFRVDFVNRIYNPGEVAEVMETAQKMAEK
jgi:putative protease